VQDADILDHFGTMEVWLKFVYSAHSEESVFDALKFWESSFCKDYYKNMREALNFDFSKNIFDDKYNFTQMFIDRFTKEINGEIVNHKISYFN
jgi:uncharacterized protein